MGIKKIDGAIFEKMLRNGLRNIEAAEREINRLNVFPVADGDTGTNMRLTVESGIRCAHSCRELNVYLGELSRGMLLGARGNSGVILSQIFRGIYLELSRTDEAGRTTLLNAFVRGYKVAYESVINPVEGTILTVAREGIEAVRGRKNRDATIESLLEDYIVSMKVVLDKTPDMLPVLGEMGVIDSGGKGYITIIEGMLMYLRGEVLPDTSQSGKAEAARASRADPDFSLFNESSVCDKGYCTEFILQRMTDPNYRQDFYSAQFTSELQALGDSLVSVEDGSRVKIHIHTKNPAPVIEHARQFGEFLTFKLENMSLQHSEYIRDKMAALSEAQDCDGPVCETSVRPASGKTRKPLAVIAVANGKGTEALFTEFGCDRILDGGETMNTSSQEFLNAIEKLDAESIVILPNGGNIIMAAEQAVKLSGAQNVHILRSKSIMEGYYALAMDIPDCEETALRIRQMENGIDNILTVAITRAVRDYKNSGVECEAGEYIAFLDSNACAASSNMIDTVLTALSKIDEIDDKDVCVILVGRDADVNADELTERINEAYPLLECSVLDGGQAIYDIILGIA